MNKMYWFVIVDDPLIKVVKKNCELYNDMSVLRRIVTMFYCTV